MKYYVVSDIHGFYTELIEALQGQGFFEDTVPHKLIVCGDIFDRGKEAKKMQKFILELIEKDEVILVRGNHEDLALDLVNCAEHYLRDSRTVAFSHHWSNKTINTFEQLTGLHVFQMIENVPAFVKKARNTPFLKKIIPATVDYYETQKYIFVHGSIPCEHLKGFFDETYIFREDWRESSNRQWDEARWQNGVNLAYDYAIKEPNKTIVCGHWHCSYGHHKYEKAGSEYGEDANFTPFYGDGIIAIDACTPISRKINCIVIKDEEMEESYVK